MQTTGATILLPLFPSIKIEEPQWVNIDVEKPPLHTDILVLKYSSIEEKAISRNVGSFFVGQIKKYLNKTAVVMRVDADYHFVHYLLLQNKPLSNYRLEYSPVYSPELHTFIEEHYLEGGAYSHKVFWQFKEKHIREDFKAVHIGFHAMNAKRLRTFWVYINKLPKSLPKI